jgi:AraC family transcriptional regulator
LVYGFMALHDPNSVLLGPHYEALGKRNCILNGRGRSYLVENYPGPLSIKSVISGSAIYETDQGRFRLHPDCFLVLNQGRSYSMHIDSPTETFCLFFRDGFAAEAARTQQTPTLRLLDNPVAPRIAGPEFVESLRGGPSSKMLAALRTLHRSIRTGNSTEHSLADSFFYLADLVISLHTQAIAEIESIPALGASTRQELYRRLYRAKTFIDDSFAGAPSLEEVARVACLSVHHFHRTFTALFKQTPHQYLTAKRIEKARQLLLADDAPVALVCGEIGFESVSSFIGLFKRYVGCSPAAFRARHKKARFENPRSEFRTNLLSA